MINENKWVNSLPKNSTIQNKSINQLDYDRWISTIPKKNAYSSITKYSFVFCFSEFDELFYKKRKVHIEAFEAVGSIKS